MESKYVTECFQGLDTRQLSFGLELLHLLPGLDLSAHVQQHVVHQLGPQHYCQGHTVHPLHAQQVYR